MKIGILKSTFLFLLMALTTFSFGQKVSLVASVDAKKVFLGTSIEVVFTIKNGKNGKFVAPIFSGFDLISGPNHGLSTQIINGKVSSEESFSYTLEPKQVGQLRIDVARFSYSGKVYKSQPIAINVLKQKGSKATTQAGLEKELGKQYFVLAEIDTTDIYLGQQVILNYKLYTQVDIQSFRILTESDYKDFFMNDIRRFDSKIKTEIYQGKEYKTKVMKKIALFPQKSGKLRVGAAKFQLGIAMKSDTKKQRSFFFSPPSKAAFATTPPIDLDVKPLPKTSKKSFSGAVGKFIMNSRIDKRKLSTDDAISIIMHIEGTGDIKTLTAPDMILSDSFEVYEPTVIAESNFDQNGLFLCTKEFEYLVLPKYPGFYKLTPKFTYFDTDSLAYITLGSQQYLVQVTQGTNKKRAIIPKSQEETEATISDIVLETTLKQKSTPFFGTIPFWILWWLPFVGVIGSVFYKRNQLQKDNVDVNVKRMAIAERVAHDRLKSAKTYLNNKNARPFYDEVSKSLFGYIGDKLQMKGSELGKDDIHSKMLSLGIESPLCDEMIDILSKSELALYAGMGNDSEMQKVYDQSLNLVSKIEDALK